MQTTWESVSETSRQRPQTTHLCYSNTVMSDSVGDFQTHKEFGHSDWDFGFDVVGLLLTFRSGHTSMVRFEQQNKVVLKARYYLLFKQPSPLHSV